MCGLEIVPVTFKEAARFVARGHRHNDPTYQPVFVVGVARGPELVGVASGARPVARALQDGRTIEVSRVCTDGTPNACSMLYGACRRAAKGLGYLRVVTYTLASEPGSSVRAAGFRMAAELKARKGWSSEGRVRVERDLFGNERRPLGPKVRWEWP